MLGVGGAEVGLGADRGAVDSEGEVEVGAGGVAGAGCSGLAAAEADEGSGGDGLAKGDGEL